MSDRETAPPLNDKRLLRILVACIAAVGVAVVCFNLLYLFVPADRSPPFGFAPDIAAAYGRTVPLPALAFRPRTFSAISLALQAAMWAAFFTAILAARKLGDGAAERAAFKRIAVGGAVVSLLLILTPPSLSKDLYHYALFGRMIITRGLNPYVTTGNVLAGEPVWQLSDYHTIPTHYGPVFTGLSILAVAVGRGGPIGTALGFKILATASGALAAWSVVALARREGRSGALPLAVVVLNPLILIETAGSGHNEMVMLSLALAGLVVARNGRRHLGFALSVASVHVKWVTAALAGLTALVWLRDGRGARARLRELATLLLIAVGLTVVLYLPFWAGRDVAATTRRILTVGSADRELHVSQFIPFVAAMLATIVVVIRFGERYLLQMAALACLAFVLFVFPVWMPWYLIPTFALLAVDPFARLNAILFSLTTVFAMFLMANWAFLVPR
jgi:hypothetical protein